MCGFRFFLFGEAEIIDSPHYTFFSREDGVGGLNKRKGERGGEMCLYSSSDLNNMQ
jgi:hypothetical protein